MILRVTVTEEDGIVRVNGCGSDVNWLFISNDPDPFIQIKHHCNGLLETIELPGFYKFSPESYDFGTIELSDPLIPWKTTTLKTIIEKIPFQNDYEESKSIENFKDWEKLPESIKFVEKSQLLKASFDDSQNEIETMIKSANKSENDVLNESRKNIKTTIESSTTTTESLMTENYDFDIETTIQSFTTATESFYQDKLKTTIKSNQSNLDNLVELSGVTTNENSQIESYDSKMEKSIENQLESSGFDEQNENIKYDIYTSKEETTINKKVEELLKEIHYYEEKLKKTEDGDKKMNEAKLEELKYTKNFLQKIKNNNKILYSFYKRFFNKKSD